MARRHPSTFFGLVDALTVHNADMARIEYLGLIIYQEHRGGYSVVRVDSRFSVSRDLRDLRQDDCQGSNCSMPVEQRYNLICGSKQTDEYLD